MDRPRRVWPAVLFTALIFFVLGTLFGAKVLTVSSDGDKTSINLDQSKVKAGAEKAAETTREVGEDLADKTQRAVNDVEVDIKKRDSTETSP